VRKGGGKGTATQWSPPPLPTGAEGPKTTLLFDFFILSKKNNQDIYQIFMLLMFVILFMHVQEAYCDHHIVNNIVSFPVLCRG
jgi:hypothetical protein